MSIQVRRSRRLARAEADVAPGEVEAEIERTIVSVNSGVHSKDYETLQLRECLN